MLNSVQGHQKGLLVADLQFSPDRTYFITASKDKTAKVPFRAVHISNSDLRRQHTRLAQNIQLRHPSEHSRHNPSERLCTLPPRFFVVLTFFTGCPWWRPGSSRSHHYS